MLAWAIKHQTTAPQQRLHLPPSERGLEKKKSSSAGRGEGGRTKRAHDGRRDNKKNTPSNEYLDDKRAQEISKNTSLPESTTTSLLSRMFPPGLCSASSDDNWDRVLEQSTDGLLRRAHATMSNPHVVINVNVQLPPTIADFGA